jgi:hypothetical protein
MTAHRWQRLREIESGRSEDTITFEDDPPEQNMSNNITF